LQTSTTLRGLATLLALSGGIPVPSHAAEGRAAAAVFLLTDYGAGGFYVGAVKGSVLEKNPRAAIHDLTHEVPAFDVRSGAFILAEATETLPPGSIVVAVVDPGVGTRRRCLAVRTQRGNVYLAPDNGLLTLVLERQGLDQAREVVNPEARRRGVLSSTFHGRDVFAPAAGWLSAGGAFDGLGPVVTDPVTFPTQPAVRVGGVARGRVVLVDRYGNVLTNLPREMVEDLAGNPQAPALAVTLGRGGPWVVPLRRSYGGVEPGAEVAVFNSLGRLEVAVNQGSLAARREVKVGDQVEVRAAP
jgi:hypothetical protein